MNFESLVGRINLIQDAFPIRRMPSAKLQALDNQDDEKWRMPSAKLEEWATPPERLFNRINYSCLLYLTSIDNPLKRAFYEQETIRGCWTYTELDRFRHEYASQLNLYMNYYKHEVMQEDDNPPIGRLSQNLFVSKYRLQLPSEDDIRKYMLENITEEQFMEMMEEGCD